MQPSYGDFGWYLTQVKHNKYKLEKHFFSPNDTAVPLRFFPDDICAISNFQIGNNLVSERIPVFAKYIKGSLNLYFSNKQIVEIKLYSDDVRTNIFSHTVVGKKSSIELCNEYFLLNGKKVLDYKKNARRVNVITLKREVN
jgi:hypothetical protein